MNHYRIYYLDKNENETTPDLAVIFRVCRDGVPIRDCFPMSRANSFIKTDILHHQLFPHVAARLDAFEKEQAIMAGQILAL